MTAPAELPASLVLRPVPDDPQDAPDAAPLPVGTGPAREPGKTLPTLAAFLPALEQERDGAAAGGVPLPREWARMRATLGGMSPASVQNPNKGAAEITEAAEHREGKYLPAGLHVITGQTGGGKSALAMNLVHAALHAGHPVVYLSLELDGVELAARLLALDTGLSWWKLAQRRALTKEMQAKRAEGIAKITARAERVTLLSPDRAADVHRVREAAVAAWQAHGKTPLVVVDYLQAVADLPTGDGEWRPSLREYIGAVSRDLRELSRVAEGADAPTNAAGERWQGCPVVTLSITARGNVREGDRGVPGMNGKGPDELRHADLETLKALPKEAGAIEAYAVTAWVAALGERDVSGKRPMTLRLAKFRGGQPGQWIPFTFDGSTGRLEEEPARYGSGKQCDTPKKIAGAGAVEYTDNAKWT